MAILIELIEEEADKVRSLRYHVDASQARQWLEVLWLLHLGESVAEVMHIAGVSKRTVGIMTNMRVVGKVIRRGRRVVGVERTLGNSLSNRYRCIRKGISTGKSLSSSVPHDATCFFKIHLLLAKRICGWHRMMQSSDLCANAI